MDRIAIYKSFAELPIQYEKIFEETGERDGFFFSLPWFQNLAGTVFQSSSDLRIYAVDFADGKPALVAPMCHAPLEKRSLTSRVLRPLANYYTALYGVAVMDNKFVQHALTLLAEAIAAERPRWDVIQFYPLDTAAPLFEALRSAFQQAGMMSSTYYCFGNWYLKVNGRSYNEYFDGLPSKLKSTVTRKRKQLQRDGRLRIEIFTDDASLAKGIAAYEQVYSCSWKEPESHPDFMPGLIQLCARQGSLRLGIAYVNNEPAAAQFWIVNNRVASIYKLAYDEKFAKLSIGSILTARLMQHVIDVDRVEEVDFLSGDYAYKRDWMSHRRERHGIVVFNRRTVRGSLEAVRHIAGKWMKLLKATVAPSRAGTR